MAEGVKLNHKNIWSESQNNPELVIEDCKAHFGFDDEQCEQMRDILLRRGINKWFLGRRMFISLKHEIKGMLRENPNDRMLVWLNMRMQGIAKLPRYVIFPKYITKNWRNVERDIVVRGRKSTNWYNYRDDKLMKIPSVSREKD